MSLDSDGNLLLVGGYAGEGYLNDAWVYSPASNQWYFTAVSGKPPTPRELSSIVVINDQGYLYGGFHEGGVSSELYMLDLENKDWVLVEDDGYLPEGREGHGLVRLGDFLFLMGGCDFGFSKCYDRIYVLDLVTMWWSKLDHKDFTPLPGQKERFGIASIGSTIYTFGGCHLNSHCFNDLMYIDTGIVCPNDCNGKGSCRGGLCVCQQGFVGAECEVETYCEDKCNYRGLCNSVAECDCYPGYKGNLCEYTVNCPKNCTSPVHGICQPNGDCLCNAGYSGPECTCKCVHGWCAGDKCLCEVGWEGDLCSIPKDLESQTKPESNQNVTKIVNESANVVVVNNTNSEAAGLYTQKKMTACIDDCNGRGICKGKVCYCKNGWTGDACEEEVDDDDGVSVLGAMAICLIFIAVGLVSGLCYIGIFSGRRKEAEQYPLIT